MSKAHLYKYFTDCGYAELCSHGGAATMPCIAVRRCLTTLGLYPAGSLYQVVSKALIIHAVKRDILLFVVLVSFVDVGVVLSLLGMQDFSSWFTQRPCLAQLLLVMLL